MTSGPVAAGAAGTWKLGDLTVNRMGLGAMRLAQTGRALVADATPGDRGRAITVLRRAVKLGVNHIDTATFYFSPFRSANELINTALAPYPDDLVIVTKVGPGRDPSGEWLPAARPGQLRGQVEENLRQLAEAQAIAPVVCVQNRYGIGASPEDHEFLTACGKQGIAFVPFFAIAGQGGGVGGTRGRYRPGMGLVSGSGA
jgi:aryl-alcohol dehydrogenase-like predicted oxidoreductase